MKEGVQSQFEITGQNEFAMAKPEGQIITGRDLTELAKAVDARITESIRQFAFDHPNIRGEHAAIAWANEQSDY